MKYYNIPLLRTPLVLPKSGLSSGMVLTLNVEYSSSFLGVLFCLFFF